MTVNSPFINKLIIEYYIIFKSFLFYFVENSLLPTETIILQIYVIHFNMEIKVNVV